MGDYAYTAITIIIISSVGIIYALHRNKMLNAQWIFSIIASMIVSSILSLMLPITLSTFSGSFALKFILAFLLTAIVYITLVLLATVCISSLITQKRVERIHQFIISNKFIKSIKDFNFSYKIKNLNNNSDKTNQEIELNSEYDVKTESSTSISNTYKKDCDKGVNADKMYNKLIKGKNILQKFVDRKRNTDKIRVEQYNEDLPQIETIKSNNMSKDEVLFDSAAPDAELSQIEYGNTAVTNDNTVGISDDKKTALKETAVTKEKELNSHMSKPEQFIDEAFRLKQIGDLQGAITCYMEALNNRPNNKTVFWVILDMCVLYKELGQSEFARQVLESYIEQFGQVMEPQVRREIENNL